ncbi:hypothetical protein KM043_013159 [Ampulex compressa]|nr:hypothetical protein KM043_013159 [Ampulex compressa]
MAAKLTWLLFAYIGLSVAWMDERPVLEARDGNLIISSAKDRNITLKILGNGYVNVNEINLLQVASAAQSAVRLIDRWRLGYLAEVETNLNRLTNIVEGPVGLQRRIAALEGNDDANATIHHGNRPEPSVPTDSTTRNAIRRVNDRVRRLEDKVRTIVTKLTQDDCQSNPCQNGGTCHDMYEGYKCHCSSNWEGPNCLSDVNECVTLLGTDLGCQNGATCSNIPGSYRCNCAPGWFGLHCTKKTSICNTQNSQELCGHGVCVSKTGSLLGYTCICEQGWEAEGTNPACVKDIDECAANHPPCSVNPPVPCRNTPGSFICGSCPHGYTGNGYYCTDIDECAVDNGGCSTAPRVQCINTMGSRICGSCPTGYRGDGISCIYVGACHINNGGCHPLATCSENLGLTSAYVNCRCPYGYIGDGRGPNGCQSVGISINTACASNPCAHGTCTAGYLHTFTCTCNPGYTGVTCNEQVDPCTPNPCKNSGTCIVSNGEAVCNCLLTFTGSRCETSRQSCGGVTRNPVGHLVFPISGNSYQHGLSCAWVLITNHSLVLNVTFTSFNLEQSTDCKFDFLQIHDGRNAGSHMIGRFCGNTLPHTSGNIVSSHNALYFWFHSDSSISHDGFAFQWNTIEPVCGGTFEDDYGTIVSPGSPGRYPPNRDCYWYIFVRPTKRIQFHFGQLMLEEHPTCENDYVKITGIDEEPLATYCNHSRPAPLITPGPEATVHFHSDSAGQDAGFQIHYSVVEGVPGCGGIYTSFNGIITSPGHINTYQANLNCEWKIQLPVGEKIKISWTKFDLEDSSSCQFDYVEVFDGPNADSQLLGRYCGSEMPPMIKSTSNTIVVVFRTDWSSEMEGFSLSYQVLCDGVFTEETGILHSPMYPNHYHASRECTYEIIQPVEKGIVLSMIDMDIEGSGPPDCYFDHLQIFDGDNENSTRLATLCGDENFLPSTPFLSTHNFMLLIFTSDFSIQGRGFKANYTTVDRRCGGLYRQNSGTIQSPQKDGYYGNDEECTWTIRAPPGHVVQLTWVSFNLENYRNCRNDYVSVYDNYTTSESSLLGTFCGTRMPPVLTTQDNIMTIVFRTDSSVTNEGFTASYLFIDTTRVCGGFYSKQNGIVRSPNYPNPYPDDKECVWIITAPNKQKVKLRVEDFELENHSSCSYDYLEIRNGGYESAPLIGKFCGKDIPTEITSQANQLYIKFVTDGWRNAKGFAIEWDSSTVGCGGVMTSASGDIISPNYPEPYAHNADCYWRIAVAAGSLVRLMIVDLDMEHHARCRFDFIEVIEGMVRRSNGVRYCNTDYPKILKSKSNIITIRFRSDFTNAGRGFHIKYETLCQNTLRGFFGVIESPNFPNKYEHSTNCSWLIEAPMGNKINLTFSHFDLEGQSGHSNCQYDYIEIKEGTGNVSNTALGTFCDSSQLPEKIHSSQNQVFITFVTDAYIAFNGFRLEWAIDGCGGHLTKPMGAFTSPGYPSAYPYDIECEWLIEVDHTHSIELTLHEVRTEKLEKCWYDKVQIYSGTDANSPELVEICYTEKPVVYTSFGNAMFVKFHSDHNYAGRGFSASYRSVAIGCGGKFTTSSGIIYSTNYPQNYPHRQNCEWLIEVDKNHVVNMTFLDFDIENSRNCTDDYVKIFDGPTRDDPLLGTHCRNDLPPPYVSTSNQMLVVMRSDSLVSAKGFKAQYTRACGARIIVKENGYITSPVSHTAALEAANCTWTLITEDPADHVTLIFSHMEVDLWNTNIIKESNCLWNYIEVLEGETSDGPSLGKWCSNVPPVPVTSTGNALTIHLVLQYEFTGYFAIMYSPLNSACGGNYSSPSGTVASPGYPESYPLGSECIWILKNSPGNRVSLSFSNFELEQSENCDLDYLEIRENDGIGKLIGIYCGTEIANVMSSSSLWIKFKSDNGGTSKGFLGEYNFLGGNELQGPTGQITSPLYPLSYKLQASFSWRITVEFGWLIRIVFRDMHIENIGTSCYYHIKIYDGYDDGAPILLEACGYVLPEPIMSTSNIVYIVMTSEMVREGSRFDLSWYQIPRDTNGPDEVDIKLSECSEEIALMGPRNSTHSFSSPGWPHGYGNSIRCGWLFTSPPGSHLVLRITNMDLEETSDCTADSLSVYSGYALTPTNDATLVQRLCFPNSTMSLVRATNVMTVIFESDSYINKTGFAAYAYRDCGGKLESPNGVIEIDNMTSTRGIRTWHFNCEWTIEVKPGRTIEVKITDMSITQGANQICSDNYLMMKNGHEPSSPLLGAGKFCGDVLPAPLRTTGNRLYVKAVGTRPNVRFKLTYRQVNMDCGGEYALTEYDNKWEISTPNYPNIPPPYAECFWKILAPAGDRISIHFIERFDLSNSENCEKEYVEIKDGGTANSKLLGRFCGDTPPSSMTTSGTMLYVHFYSEMSEPKNGFKASVVSGEVCGGIIRGTSGVINSPNYPFSYPKNQTCVWRIIGPTDHTLKIQFRDFHLPGFRRCEYSDHVIISEKVAENDTLSVIGKFCGFTKPDLIETSFNEVTVVFRSDNREYAIYKGFSMNFTSSLETCGGELTAMSGVIKSTGYPNPSTRSRYCDWRIKLPLGYQVVVDILDLSVFEIPRTTRLGYSVSFYNDLRYKSRIKVIGQTPNTDQVRSSSNNMMIGYWSSTGHRGIKFRYRAEAPAPCGGLIQEAQGVITPPQTLPFNASSFFCQWSLQPPESLTSMDNDTGLTLSVKVSGYVGGHEGYFHSKYCVYPQFISVTGVGMLCGNITEPKYIRSPKPVNELTIVNGTYGKLMRFNLEYQWQTCGGILRGPSHTVQSPKHISYPINCAWHVDYPTMGEMIKLTFSRFNLGTCDQGYMIIRNGGSNSPKIGKFCGNIKPNITSTSNQLWIEYYASADPNDFEFNLELASTGCGGILRRNSKEISSPGFPKQYPANAECAWEITGDNGYHVGLSFVDRFNLEISTNCEKDYVQVFNWATDKGPGGYWSEIAKVCGRNTPAPINSTANRMKVIFHSDDAIQGDGFRALWSENCGGIFNVTTDVNVIQSPAYPGLYKNNLNCNYTFVAPNQDIVVQFTDFQLETGRGNCQFDNVTVLTKGMFMMEEDDQTFCGNELPPLLRSTSEMQIIFKTDKYVQRHGFQFKYFITNCGGILTEPGDIAPLMHNGKYFGRLNCTWLIRAPEGKSITVRFEKFVLEYSPHCYYDYVTAYDGDSMETGRLMGEFCGNLTDHLPTLKSESNVMVVNFKTDDSQHYEGFEAKVLFNNNPASGCGGAVNLTGVQQQTFRTQKTAMYESLEDCHWKVTTPPGKVIKLTINSMDIKNMTNSTRKQPADNECSGDYLEIRDGGGMYSELIGRYCGNTVPLPIVSSANSLWIRFYSDGTEEGAGAVGTLTAIDSLCGLSVRPVNDSINLLVSPNYPNTYQAGTQCRWILRHPDDFRDMLLLRFVEFDLSDSERCENEYVQITDKQNRKYINEGFGEDFVFSGRESYPVSVTMGSRLPMSSYRYCGSALPHDFYSYSNEVEVLFKGATAGHKGFKIEYSTPPCNRSYTNEQGRIVHQGFNDCTITIEAPVGYTISLYFNQFRLYDMEQCTTAGLQIRDGDANGNLINTLCGITLPSPIFSTGNKLTLYSWSTAKTSYGTYDITYTTTDKGRGCGGKIFNYGGKFSSPLYPNAYRNNTVCTWDVSVPQGFKIVLEFSNFDISNNRSCATNSVKIYDALPNGARSLHSTYCGGDDPAQLEADGNRIFVVYSSTVNNGGTGWVIMFMGKPTSHSLEILS